jgi:hypothetical protein
MAAKSVINPSLGLGLLSLLQTTFEGGYTFTLPTVGIFADFSFIIL